jgi:hypothetical protein
MVPDTFRKQYFQRRQGGSILYTEIVSYQFSQYVITSQALYQYSQTCWIAISMDGPSRVTFFPSALALNMLLVSKWVP